MSERTPSGRMGQQVHDYKLKMPGRVAKAIKKGGPAYDTRDNNPHKQASDHLHAVAKKHGVTVKRFHRDMTGHYAHLHPNQDKGKVHAMLTDYEKTVGKAVKESATNMRNLKLINKIKKSGVVKQGSMKKEGVKSADKKPETYTKPDGKRGVRMVPVDKDITKVDEVLDTPKAMQSYRDKNKRSKEKAANSAAAKVLRGPDKDGKRADHSPELNTMRKRRDGEKMADRLAGRKTLALVRKQGMKMRKEAVQLDELSPRTKASYYQKAKAQNKSTQKAYDKSVKSNPDKFFGPDSPEDQKRAKTMDKRQKGIAQVRGRKYGQKLEAYNEPQGQAKRMMSPLQKMRMDKEKADRDRDGKLKPGVTKKKEATIPPGKTIMTKKPDLTRNDADKLAKIRQMLDKEKKK